MDSGRSGTTDRTLSTQRERVLPLDGLRGAAIALVLVHHFAGPFTLEVTDGFTVLDPGSSGVRLFFVLSGYLITGILLSARLEAERVGVSRWTVWRSFAIRRSLRIFPLAYAALGVAWLSGVPEMRNAPWVFLGYALNFVNAWAGVETAPTLGHFWSLAIEEHFYLVWPFVVLLVPRRDLPAVILATVVAATVLRTLTAGSWGPAPAYWLTWCRLDTLAFGGWLAIVRPTLGRVLLSGGVLLALSATMPSRPAAWVGVSELGSIMLTGALVLAVAQGWAGRVWTWRPLVGLGTISYGVYVWHYMLPRFMQMMGFAVPTNTVLSFVVLTSLALAIAWASWVSLEKPINDLRRYFPYVPAAKSTAQALVHQS